MLKLSVGYQHNREVPFSSVVRRYNDKIGEVYFPWIDQPSGRSMLGGCDGYFDYSLQSELITELSAIKELGIKLNLLFNANCYGDEAISRVLEQRTVSIIDYLTDEGVRPDGITTASPAIAHVVKEHCGDISVRASVNMKICSVEGMSYVAPLFDGFCLAKECNRDLEMLAELYAYAKENGKHITLLANSGCLRNCSGQIFHDNMVAHEAGIAKQKNINFMPYMCWNYLKDKENLHSVLQNTWIRPEDINRYENLTDIIKLATRAHALPGMVIGAYAKRRYFGNLLDLFEPSFTPAFLPYVIDSSKIPSDFWQKTTECNKKCDRCNYCKKVLDGALTLEM